MYLPVQLLPERLHHAGAEAAPGRMLNRRAAPFGPGQAHPLLFLIEGPSDFYAAVGIRKGSELDRIGAKFIQRHCESDDRARGDPNIGAIEMETPGSLVVVGLGRAAKSVGEAGALPTDLH